MPRKTPYVTEKVLRHTIPQSKVITAPRTGKTTIVTTKPSTKNPQVRVPKIPR